MADLIDRQTAIETAIEAADKWDGGYSSEREEIIRKFFDKVPAVQPTCKPECKPMYADVSDTISRQAAIDALDVLCQEHRYRIPGKRETYSQYNEAWQDALDRAEVAIGNLPSVQQEIIRCKDCKYMIDTGDDLMCDNAKGWVVATASDFGCVLAERRTDG